MQDIFAQDFEAIQAHELEIAKQMALKFVSARMRTTHEVLEHLQKKSCSFEQSQAAVLFLKEYPSRFGFFLCPAQKEQCSMSKNCCSRTLLKQTPLRRPHNERASPPQ